MDRMTTRTSDGEATLSMHYKTKGEFEIVVARLAAYEDTGIEPSRVNELIAQNECWMIEWKKLNKVYDDKIHMANERIAVLEQTIKLTCDILNCLKRIHLFENDIISKEKL